MDTISTFDFSGGRLCLDFANTIGDRPAPQPHQEDLRAYGDLVAWSEAADILSGDTAAELRREAARRPDEARAAFDRGIALREAIYRVFSSIAADAEPPVDDLAAVQGAAAAALSYAHLVSHDGHFDWQFIPDTTAFDTVLWPVAWSAATLLTADDLHRVHECAGPECSWLFMDLSKNGSRRWCSMSSCGNRAKARRHRARQKTAPASGA